MPAAPTTGGENPVASVIVITRNRHEMLARCLDHLLRQEGTGPYEVIVVDSSEGPETRELVRSRYPGVTYLHLADGKNRMPASRNLGIEAARGAVIAFVDDDALAAPDWLAELLQAYEGDPAIGGVGGLVIEPNLGLLPAPAEGRPIGKVLPDGERVANYHCDPGRAIDVDLVKGCNMSFRREAMRRVGGFDPGYTGSNVFEAGDYCARLRRAGYRLRFTPRAAVEHLVAPREEIPRELADPRAQFYNARNWTYWLLKNYGPRPTYWRRLWWVDPLRLWRAAREGKGLGLSSVGEAVAAGEGSFRRPSPSWLLLVNLAGKAAGTIAWLAWLLGRKEPRLRLDAR